MTERPRPIEGERHRDLRLRAGVRALGAESLDVVRRASLHENGLSILERAPLECAAVLLGVDPRSVERARAALSDPGLRPRALEAFARAAHGRGRTGEPSAPAARPASPEEIVAEAERRPGGLALLASASAECAAVVFGVHPEVVGAARALLAGPGAGGPDL